VLVLNQPHASSLRVMKSARSASACARWLSVAGEGRQKEPSTARRTPASSRRVIGNNQLD